MTSPEIRAQRWSSGRPHWFAATLTNEVWAANPGTIMTTARSGNPLHWPGRHLSRPRLLPPRAFRRHATGTWTRNTTEWTGQHQVWSPVAGRSRSTGTIWSASRLNPRRLEGQFPNCPSNEHNRFDTPPTLPSTPSSAPTSLLAVKTKHELAVAIDLACLQSERERDPPRNAAHRQASVFVAPP